MKEENLIYIAGKRLPTEKAHGFSISKMCEKFSELNQDVEIWAMNRKTPIDQNIFEYYQLKNNFKIKYIGTIDLFPYDFINNKFCYWISNLTFHIQVSFRLILRNFKSDFYIYTRDKIAALLYSLFFEVYWEANDNLLKKNFLIKFILKKCKGIIVVTKWLKERYIDKFELKKEKILIARNGIDLEEFKSIIANQSQLREELGLPIDKKILGYLGKFKTKGKNKGVSFLIRSMQKLRDLDNLVLCCVGGEKENREEVLKLAKELKVEDKVILKGHVNHKKAVKYMKSFDIAAMPFPKTFHYSYKMSPIKMFEYMGTKKAIVATNLPAISEVLENKKDALLFEPDSINDFVNKIKTLYKDNKLREKLGSQAFEKVSKNYTWENRAKSILEFMNK